jgi:hypothetical protein
MPPEVHALEANVALGVEVERFLAGPIGQMFAQRCESDRLAALEALAYVDLTDAAAGRALQNQIKVIDAVQQYLADGFTNAQAALARLEQLETGD